PSTSGDGPKRRPKKRPRLRNLQQDVNSHVNAPPPIGSRIALAPHEAWGWWFQSSSSNMGNTEVEESDEDNEVGSWPRRVSLDTHVFMLLEGTRSSCLSRTLPTISSSQSLVRVSPLHPPLFGPPSSGDSGDYYSHFRTPSCWFHQIYALNRSTL